MSLQAETTEPLTYYVVDSYSGVGVGMGGVTGWCTCSGLQLNTGTHINIHIVHNHMYAHSLYKQNPESNNTSVFIACIRSHPDTHVSSHIHTYCIHMKASVIHSDTKTDKMNSNTHTHSCK